MVDAPYRLLVVDDEPVVLELTVDGLQHNGFMCDSANNGIQAIKMFKRTQHTEPYDAVVTDLRMPTLNGHAMAIELLATKNCPPIVVMTAVTQPKLITDLLVRGVHDVLSKPVDFDLLSLKLHSMIDWSRQPALATNIQ